jgi:hypothetical protein
MTSPALLEEVTRHHQEQYALSWDVIDQAEKLMASEDAEPPAFPDLPASVAQVLLTPTGQKELIRWHNAFSRSIDLMRQFNKERARGKRFNASDWKLMDESATKAVDLLKKAVIELATAQ